MVENQDGLVVVELLDDNGLPMRIAALNEHTDLGTDVIGLAFLGPAEIAELESMESQETALFGPAPVAAHFQDQSHYHYFYNCSWVYQQGGTYAISWYMCPNDTFWDRKIGQALTIALSAATRRPILIWLGGMLTVNIEGLFYQPDGSLRGSVSDYRPACGWINWGAAAPHWLYYYCAGTTYYGYAWDDLYDRLFYVVYE